MVLLDVSPANMNVSLTNLLEFLKGYGVDAPNKIIVDLLSAQLVGNPVQPLAAWFNPDQPITRELGSPANPFRALAHAAHLCRQGSLWHDRHRIDQEQRQILV